MSIPAILAPKPKDFRVLPVPDPLDVEIGCGVGFHPIRYCLENPNRTLWAFERTEEKFQKFFRRLERHPQIKNLQAIRGDGVLWMAHLQLSQKVDRIFLLYPNPCPKNSQKNLRFHNMDLFHYVLEALKIGGTVTMATNEAFYREEALSVMRERWGLELISDLPWEGKPRTHFEKKYLARSQSCWNLEWKKTVKNKN